MREIWSGTISFGLVNIPVKIYSSIENHMLELTLLRRADLCPIRYVRVCQVDNKEVPWEDIVKGYEYQKGDYVVLEPEDFEQANIKKSHSIEIDSFVQEKEIDSIYYSTPYYLSPQNGGQKAYAILREALKETQMVGVGEFIMRNREHFALIKPFGNILLLQKLHYIEEIRSSSFLTLPEANLIKGKELNMAKKLVKQLAAKFKPEKYKDTYINDLKKIIAAKAKGKKLYKPKHIEERNTVVDIMDLLKQSLKKSQSK